ENHVDNEHDPARHVADADYQSGGNDNRADGDEAAAPQPQRQAAGGGDEQTVERGDTGVQRGGDARHAGEFFGLLGQRFADIGLFLAGMAEQLHGQDVAVAVDDAPGQLR